MNVPTFTDIHTGLTTDAVARKPKNAIHHKKSVIILLLETFGHQVASLFFLLLAISGILSYYLKDYSDAIIFVSIAFVNTILGTVQEFRSAHTAQALQSLISHDVTVIRDGKEQDISYEALVEGDIVLLAPGDVAAADLYVREAEDVLADESILTGETNPVEKKEGDTISSGVSLASGSATGQVMAVGKKNSLVSYSKEVESIKKGNSFDLFIARIGKILLVAVLACLLVTVVHAYFFTVSFYSVGDFVLYAISMLVSVVPEALPLVITLTLMHEALLLAGDKVLIKRLRALQELGSLRYLFTDKTGTLTQNNLRVVETDQGTDFVQVATMLCNACYEHTPLDKTFDGAIAASLNIIAHQSIPVTVTPFKTDVGYARYVFADRQIIRGQFLSVYQATKTAPSQTLLDKYNTAEKQGLRVIALASRSDASAPYAYNGFFAFEDPLKSDAIELYKECHDINIPIVVMTGDSAAVGTYIAQKLDSSLTAKNVCSLQDTAIDILSDAELQQMRVFSRCHPENKLSIIDRYKPFGTIGFIGDGINDALALKAADIGIVVNNASDVARQSADILLFEKSLEPIIKAVRMSRRTYTHIMTYLLCTLTGNIGTLFALTVFSLFTSNLPMLPIQILLTNLLTDAPLLLLSGDNLDDDVETRRPHFTPRNVFTTITLFAALNAIFYFAYFIIFRNVPLPLYRTGWFLFSVFAGLVVIFTLRSNKQLREAPPVYRPLLWAIMLCGLIALVMPYISALQKLFTLVPVPLSMLSGMLILLVGYVFCNEYLKKLMGGVVH
jgi:Mg2+-importing ATPase